MKDKINGILVNKDNILDFADKICKINENKIIIDDMRNNYLNSIKKFDLNVNSERLIDIYKKFD